MKYKYIIGLLFLLSAPFIVSAHPGRTDSNGGHYCRTNCSSWGEVQGAWHSHSGGSTYTSPSSYTPSYNSYSTPTVTCPSNSYLSGGSCTCNYGYVVQNGSCVSGDNYCSEQYGIMSNYDSLTNKCKCSYGYELGASGRCQYKSSTYSSPTHTYSSYLSEDTTEHSCPDNSSKNTAGNCSCDTGYKLNKIGSRCIKMKKADNNKLCKAEFGKNSQWSGAYDEDTGSVTCSCKKKYEWSSDGDSCVKSD